MRKRVHIALAVLLVAIVGVIVRQALRLREPVYAGSAHLRFFGGSSTG
jgi:hypothetical protein